ncbi:hypothetical protein HanXRQr2_Chr13g0565761 [Helianthus annuus]|uniref:Uncharacterized protein n=1 Tax=Helianthus annuus TaxID=4232 RepID=A0A9K3EEA8_HELAN|nr:hypothetical protein HanXRQr2_Chr13g0565761 [Helianthus annuus]KAJ0479116.1 hypothetical protein HanIR_Chr13g0616411 [Helianthus annuus]KAJ0847407.1 hypothetical protein HanPSC8_Chr13g0544971 [Helianthus annuus]
MNNVSYVFIIWIICYVKHSTLINDYLKHVIVSHKLWINQIMSRSLIPLRVGV